ANFADARKTDLASHLRVDLRVLHAHDLERLRRTRGDIDRRETEQSEPVVARRAVLRFESILHIAHRTRFESGSGVGHDITFPKNVMIHSRKPTQAMMSAALARPSPVSVGFAAIIFFASSAFLIAIGSRMKPTQKRPMIANFSASFASSHASLIDSNIGT